MNFGDMLDIAKWLCMRRNLLLTTYITCMSLLKID